MVEILKSRLKPLVAQRYPEFEKHYLLGTSKAYYFHEVDCRDWHNGAVERILDLCGSRKHFPIFRLSHGEFIMALGYRAPRLNGRGPLLCYGITKYHAMKRLLGLEPAFRSGSNHNSWEEFTKAELKQAKISYIRNLAKISKEGMLCAAFFDNPGFNEYFPDYFDWMDRNGVELNENNYIPFYSIYVLLAGSRVTELLQGRRILLVTSFPGDKAEVLTRALMKLGAADVQCYPVHPSKALFETIDLNQVKGSIDISFVGAGVGSAAIIEQLRPLQSVCFDAGFGLDMLAYPELRRKRSYCLPDDMFDLRKIEYFSDARKKAALEKWGDLTGPVSSS